MKRLLFGAAVLVFFIASSVQAQSQCAVIDASIYKSGCASLTVPATAYPGETFTIVANLASNCTPNGIVSISAAATDVIVDGVAATATSGTGYIYFSEIQPSASVKVPVTGFGDHTLTFTIRSDAKAACVIQQGSSFSGPWAHVSGASVNFSTSVPFAIEERIVTPGTALTAPIATVNGNSVTIVLQKFTGASTKRSAAKALRALRKATKIGFKYQVTLQRTNDSEGKPVKSDIRQKTYKKNELTLKNLKSGSYQVQYKVLLTKKKDGETVSAGKTKPSPVTGFTIG